MTVKEMILRLAELASVHGDDMEVVALLDDRTACYVDDLELSPQSEAEVTVRLLLGDRMNGAHEAS